MAQTFEPLYDHILVRPVTVEDKTAGGIIIPDHAKERPRAGQVLEVGAGHVLEDGTVRPLLVRPGDKVMFGKWGGQEIQLGNETLLILREAECLGRIIEVQPHEAEAPAEEAADAA